MDLNNMQLLLVEDDIDLATAVIEYFALDNMHCEHAVNGLSGFNLIKSNHYDVVILDLNMPKMNGLEVCEKLRALGVDVPILMLTAKDTLDDKLQGFTKGADDYLVKPFAMEELIARVHVLSRRRSGEVTQLTVLDLTLNTQQKTVSKQSVALKLSPISFKILEILMRAYPNPVSRENLLQTVWGDDQPDSNSLKVHMFNLRKTIEKTTYSDTVNKQKLIHTIVGYGFVLKEAALS